MKLNKPHIELTAAKNDPVLTLPREPFKDGAWTQLRATSAGQKEGEAVNIEWMAELARNNRLSLCILYAPGNEHGLCRYICVGKFQVMG